MARSAFISCTRADSDFAQRLTSSLNHAGIRTHSAFEELSAGESWIEKLEESLSTVEAFIYIDSAASRQSKSIQLELREAVERKKRYGLNLIVISRDGTSPISLIDTLQTLDAQNQSVEQITEKISGLLQKPQSSNSPKMDWAARAIHQLGRSHEAEVISDQLKQSDTDFSFAIFGPPGSGKSALVQRVALDLFNEGSFESIAYIEGRKITSIEDFWLQMAGELDLTPSDSDKELVLNTASESRTLFVLDGLDEIPRSIAPKFLPEIQSLKEAMKPSKLVYTARPELLSFSVGQQFNLGPLSRQSLLEVIRNHLAAKGSPNAGAATEIADWLAKLEPEANSPILATLVADLWSWHKEIPANIEDFSEILLSRLDSEQQKIVFAIATVDSLIFIRTLETLTDINRTELLEQLAKSPLSNLLVLESGFLRLVHKAIEDAIRRRCESLASESNSGALYIALDPSMFVKEDVVELLEALNEVYESLGGEKLVIREDEVGRFVRAGLLA